jgi:predicted extracellular nuclease
VSVDPDTAHTWFCSSTGSYAEANGYGDSAPANEWLISPPLNLDAQDNDTLNFRNYTSYTDIDYPQLQVLYSTDYDGSGDPTSATWTALTGINFSPENSFSWVASGNIDLSGISGTNVYIAFQYTSSGTGGSTAARWRVDAINVFELPPEWVINEIHADPDTTYGDANGDGISNYSADEFVEIVNISGVDQDISGWTLSDGYSVRHTFPPGTVVLADCSVVVFGGGTPTGTFGYSVAQVASTGALGLNNGGDTVTIKDSANAVAAASAYGGEGGDNQSLTLDPDITGDSYVKHTLATGSDGALFSPGTLTDGFSFSGCITPIHEIQGTGLASPLDGRAVTIEGVVVGDFQSNNESDNGDLSAFFVQEEDAQIDADLATSEGIFVFDGSGSVDVAVGDHVRVAGVVDEFFSMTEITSVSRLIILSHNNILPEPATVTLPVDSIDDLEAYEGMSILMNQELYISEFFNFDRFGEIVLTTERQFQPTATYEPGSPEAAQLALANSLSRITLDDGRGSSNPDPAIHPNGDIFDLTNRFRGGDTVQNVTGVLDYNFGAYKIQPTQGADYTSVNPRPTQPDDVGGNLKVASFNVLNYFTSIDFIQDSSSNNDPADDVCGPPGFEQECRGADTDEEFERQRAKIIAAISQIDADIVGLIEIENNEFEAVADLVAGLNDVMGSGTYAYVDTGYIGTDAIKVALIYKPATVSLIGDYAILDSSVDSRFIDTRNRPALAQTFADNEGGIFTVVVNHLKSKGSGCGPGDDDPQQGNCNLTRTLAAQALVDWLATNPTGSGDADFVIMGDLNSYDKEDPIDALLAGDYTDLVKEYQGEYAYSYVFDGQLGYLDHALAGSYLTDEVMGVTVWHINADEPDILDYDMTFKQPAQDALYEPNAYRSSDHDPVIVGLDLDPSPVCTEVYPSVETLWPVNHKLVSVDVLGVTHPKDDVVTITIDRIFQDEPVNGTDDGDTAPDGQGIGTATAAVRAERDGLGNGRVYHIYFTARDSDGDACTGKVNVSAPLSQGEDGAAIDDGPLYDSTVMVP